MSPKVRSAFFCGVLAAALATVPLHAVAEELGAADVQQVESVVLESASTSSVISEKADSPDTATLALGASDTMPESDQVQKAQDVDPARQSVDEENDTSTIGDSPSADGSHEETVDNANTTGVVPLFRTSPGSVGIVAGSSSRATV
mgnify:CR=1 FL=1